MFLGRVLVATVRDYRNVIVLAFADAPSELKVSSLGKRAKHLAKQFGFPLDRVFRNICGVNVCRGGYLIV